MIGAIKLKRLKLIYSLGECLSHFVYYLVCVSVIHFCAKKRTRREGQNTGSRNGQVNE
eukprot:UN19835